MYFIMTLNLITLLTIACITLSVKVTEDEWVAFKLYHSRNFTESENAIRRKLFKKNVRTFKKHNNLYRKNKVSFMLDTNCEILDQFKETLQFSDSLINYASLKQNNIFKNTPDETFIPSSINIPSEVDWRKKGAVTSVKDTERCNSCYAFAAAEVLEAQFYFNYKKLVSLSAQQFVDCSFAFGNLGCTGGYPEKCFEYAQKHAIASDKIYPYIGNQGTCQSLFRPATLYVKKIKKVKQYSERDLLAAVAKTPVSAGIDVTHLFKCYKKGILYDPYCNDKFGDLNHAVLIVGYGEEHGQKYWLVKNSWGTTWGDSGYAKLARDRNNNCGIATHANFAKIYMK